MTRLPHPDEDRPGLDDAEGMIDGEYDGDGWCIDCGDEFHLDDCGGYNPPCACGFHCRSCHEANEREDDEYDDDDDGYDPRYIRDMESQDGAA